MMSNNDGGPAFPRPQAETSIGGNTEQDGMTMRDYFAAQALLATVVSKGGNRALNHIAQWAFEMADAMLAERNKDNG